MIFAGIDAGSRMIKAVILDGETNAIMADGVREQGVRQERIARDLYEELVASAGIETADVDRIVATGYGRHGLSFADKSVTEITCHARGVRHVMPDAISIIEIGGQDSKFIRMDEYGTVEDFAMNDRCAAGTGHFLEMVATRLEVDLDTLGTLAASSADPANISSMCVVFAETEIIGLLAGDNVPEDIAAGVQASIATRVAAMAGAAVIPPIAFTGGVAKVPGMAKALENTLGHPVTIAPQPMMTGALGAALVAAGK
jgi:predicted CoA-substrate-specific enzyme activase